MPVQRELYDELVPGQSRSELYDSHGGLSIAMPGLFLVRHSVVHYCSR
jgi:hypothetical protein